MSSEVCLKECPQKYVLKVCLKKTLEVCLGNVLEVDILVCLKVCLRGMS
jgi:hypothetical protein